MTKLKLITTDDGSHSLYNSELRETYHSTHGARQESEHVFIKSGLEYWSTQKNNATELSVFEVGFGTGLNAMLSLDYAKHNGLKMNYITIEPYPIPSDLITQLNYAFGKNQPYFEQLHAVNFNEKHEIVDGFTFEKRKQTLAEVNLENDFYDLVFYDAFAPNKQPELWDKECFEQIATIMKSGGVFVTYCAKGQLRRDLMSLGFEVESIPGPPGKREMTRATLIQ